MSDVMTLGQIEDEMLRLVSVLEMETDRLLTLGKTYAQTDSEFRKRRAMAYLSASVPNEKGKVRAVADREAEAQVATADLDLTRRIAEVTYEACREKCRTVRAALDTLRSVNSNARAQT